MENKEKQINPEEIGIRIRTQRQIKGMTQERLAELADLSTPYVSHIERGKKHAGVDTLVRISTALDTTFDFLLTGRYPPGQNNSFQFQEVLADCSPKEITIICEIAAASKNSIRKNL